MKNVTGFVWVDGILQLSIKIWLKLSKSSRTELVNFGAQVVVMDLQLFRKIQWCHPNNNCIHKEAHEQTSVNGVILPNLLESFK